MGNTDIIQAQAETNADTSQICSMCKNAGRFLQTRYLHILMTWADHTDTKVPTPVPGTSAGKWTWILPVLLNKVGVTAYVPPVAFILQNAAYGYICIYIYIYFILPVKAIESGNYVLSINIYLEIDKKHLKSGEVFPWDHFVSTGTLEKTHGLEPASHRCCAHTTKQHTPSFS